MSERGRWDRTASTGDRALAHQRAIAHGAARAIFDRGRGVTVTDVVRHAGVGRNTFYEYFDGLHHAVASAEADALEQSLRAFAPSRDARTPIERLRRMATEWLGFAAREPHLAALVIFGDGRTRGAHTRLREAIRAALHGVAQSARAAGVIGRPVDAIRLWALAGTFVAFAERMIEEGDRADPGRFSEDLVDFSLRALR